MTRRLAWMVLAGCGGGVTTEPARPAPACVAEGTWTIEWTSSPEVPELMPPWTLGRELAITIAADTVDALDADGNHVRVDRAACRVRIERTLEISYSDDAGAREERLAIEVELRGDVGTVRGRFDVHETEPPSDEHATVSGTARRDE